MSNMSYVRFENTYKDLRDCYNNMDDPDLSDTESKYRKFIIELCISIAEEYSERLED